MNQGKPGALAENPAGAALQAAVAPNAIEVHPAWPMISRLPVMLSVNIPLTGFRVCDLLALEPGQTILSKWVATEEVPLKVGDLQLSWGEFEVVDNIMALRLTRLM